MPGEVSVKPIQRAFQTWTVCILTICHNHHDPQHLLALEFELEAVADIDHPVNRSRISLDFKPQR